MLYNLLNSWNITRICVLTCILYCTNIFAATDPNIIQINPLFSGVSAEEAQDIAADAYVYAYPLVLMELTRRVMTNVPEAADGRAPMNQFANMKTFPDASFTDVVRPNADTLYSSLWFDVSKEPLVINIPATAGRYYLMPMLDMWTDIFTSPGSRTSGDGKQTFVLANNTWAGKTPKNATLIRTPTNSGWILGRINTDGTDDYPNVWKLQEQLSAIPLSKYGKNYTPKKNVVDPKQDMSSPSDQIRKMSARDFFSMFCAVSKNNPPHSNDNPILLRMSRIGIEPGKTFNVTNPEILKAIDNAPVIGIDRIQQIVTVSGVYINGWCVNLTAIGTYGTDYIDRAGIAQFGLGANTIEDAVYPTAFAEQSGEKFLGTNKYVLHFDKGQTPPINGFWSLTMYNDKQLFAANSINRYAIGNRNPLTYNADGSLDIYIQRQSPGADKESNWLPTPEAGEFTMNLRLYWPKFTVLNQSWSPPPVQQIK